MAADNVIDVSEAKDVLKIENVVRKHPLLASYVPHNSPAVTAAVEDDALTRMFTSGLPRFHRYRVA
jgi:hypothetical protein